MANKISVVKEEPLDIPGGSQKYNKVPKYFWAIVVCGFIAGIVGGIIGLIFLSSTTIGNRWRAELGITNMTSIFSSKTEKLKLEESSAIIDASKKVKKSVVSITAQNLPDIYGRESISAGSGFIITSNGLIATNKHVVSDETAKYYVYTSDGKKYDAKVLARDPYKDFAVLKIDAKSLQVAEFGDSDKLQIGQWVIAIGNALGEYENTVTIGVVSGKNRQVSPTDPSTGQTESLEGMIQTDASIFPGNSGGPLLNLKGQVVGINTAKGADQGLGFAIPINALKSAIDSVEKNGKIIRPMLGIRYIPVTSEVKQNYNLTVDNGVLIYAGEGQQAVVPGSPAAKAGLKLGDVITAVDGEQVAEDNSLANLIQKYQVGDKVELTVIRDKKEMKVSVRLAELK